MKSRKAADRFEVEATVKIVELIREGGWATSREITQNGKVAVLEHSSPCLMDRDQESQESPGDEAKQQLINDTLPAC